MRCVPLSPPRRGPCPYCICREEACGTLSADPTAAFEDVNCVEIVSVDDSGSNNATHQLREDVCLSIEFKLASQPCRGKGSAYWYFFPRKASVRRERERDLRYGW